MAMKLGKATNKYFLNAKNMFIHLDIWVTW